MNTSNKDYYINVWKGKDYDPLFIDPFESYNYQLDSLSAAQDIGKLEYAKLFRKDILNKDRNDDAGPDLGAYERIEKEDEN